MNSDTRPTGEGSASRTYGLDPDHCDCCLIAVRVARAVDHPRTPYLSRLIPRPRAGHCGCCQAGIAQLDYARRQQAMIADLWRRELARSARADHLLSGALRLLPDDAKVPDDLEQAARDDAEAWQRLREDYDRAEAARVTLIQGITSILWTLEGGPTDPVYAHMFAKIRADHIAEDVVKVLHRTLAAAHRAWQHATASKQPNP